jgi:RES domain-containing protein
VPVEGPDAFNRGELISTLLDDSWGVFDDQIQCDGLAQDLAVSILYADLRPKERYDYPDYEGFFRDEENWLENNWDEKAYAALTEGLPSADKEGLQRVGRAIDDDLPDQIEIAFEDLATQLPVNEILHRARIHKDRTRTARYEKHELSAPPPQRAKAGRANRKGDPVLYLATNKSTALAEVRAWKGAAVALAPVRIKRNLLLVDLKRPRPLKSPFFVDLLRWRVQLFVLLHRLGEDMSRPVMPHEEKLFYRPTQLLAWLIRSSGYDGFVYPSAMGSGSNIALSNPDDVEIMEVNYVRVKRAAYFSEPLHEYEDIYEEGPYDSLLSDQ